MLPKDFKLKHMFVFVARIQRSRDRNGRGTLPKIQNKRRRTKDRPQLLSVAYEYWVRVRAGLLALQLCLSPEAKEPFGR
jgi:hypothetical protein